ncbi:hypothetical protein U1Q18_049855 [Sarracenia purpurea var. burkii]
MLCNFKHDAAIVGDLFLANLRDSGNYRSRNTFSIENYSFLRQSKAILDILLQCEVIKAPTLKPIDNFAADADATVIKKEIQDDRNTDRDKLAKLWFHRTLDQRWQIDAYYNSHFLVRGTTHEYGPLVEDFQWTSDRSLKHLYTDSFLRPGKILGKTVYEVIDNKWKEKGAIEIILCADDKEMKDRIAKFYQSGKSDY